jgi:hypothetical protein
MHGMLIGKLAGKPATCMKGKELLSAAAKCLRGRGGRALPEHSQEQVPATHLCGAAGGVHQAHSARAHVGCVQCAREQLVVSAVHRVAALECHHVSVCGQVSAHVSGGGAGEHPAAAATYSAARRADERDVAGVWHVQNTTANAASYVWLLVQQLTCMVCSLQLLTTVAGPGLLLRCCQQCGCWCCFVLGLPGEAHLCGRSRPNTLPPM